MSRVFASINERVITDDVHDIPNAGLVCSVRAVLSYVRARKGNDRSLLFSMRRATFRLEGIHSAGAVSGGDVKGSPVPHQPAKRVAGASRFGWSLAAIPVRVVRMSFYPAYTF